MTARLVSARAETPDGAGGAPQGSWPTEELDVSEGPTDEPATAWLDPSSIPDDTKAVYNWEILDDGRQRLTLSVTGAWDSAPLLLVCRNCRTLYSSKPKDPAESAE